MFVSFIIVPLLLTLFIETGLYMILKHRDLKLFLIVGIMNLLLNPTMNLLLWFFGDTQLNYWLILIVGEVLTTLIESLIVYLFMKFKYLKILLFAFIANASSFFIGLAIEPIYDNKTALLIVSILCLLGYLISYAIVLLTFIRKNQNIES